LTAVASRVFTLAREVLEEQEVILSARTTLVTIVGPGGRRDLSLPADAPIRELLPPLIDLAGEFGNGQADYSLTWTLSPAAGEPMSPDTSLSEQSILDGTVLYLAPARPDGTAPAPEISTPSPDDLTPQERTEAALPGRLTTSQRVGGVLKVMFSEPPAGVVAAEEPAPRHSAAGTETSVTRPSPAELTVYRKASVLERARNAWRESDYVERLCAQIGEPRLRRCVTIAVVSPKGGVGKTTITALIGSLLSLLRRDRVVAVDTNPDYGSLGRVLAPDNQSFVDDFLRHLQQPDLTLTELDALMGRSAHGLMVLPAPVEPERMATMDEDAYTQLITRLKEFVGIVVLDCGTGLQEPAARAAIKAADQLLLVTDEQPAAASLVAEAAPLLLRSGRPVTLAVNKMPRKGNMLNVDLLGRHIPQARGLVVIPRELEAASQLAVGRFDWRDAPASWQERCAELVVSLLSDWPRLGLTL
jgi:MinD-like ATPase involved in chromosome partitioning or flagellar assembly